MPRSISAPALAASLRSGSRARRRAYGEASREHLPSIAGWTPLCISGKPTRRCLAATVASAYWTAPA
jgi:hypothetical protein